MKEQGSSVALVTLVAFAVSFNACNRVQGMKSAQAVTGVVAQPAPQKPQPSAAAQAALLIPSSPWHHLLLLPRQLPRRSPTRLLRRRWFQTAGRLLSSRSKRFAF